MLAQKLLQFAAVSTLVLSLALPKAHPEPSIETISRFSNQTWLEAIAARRNGKLLVTRYTNRPSVFEVDPAGAEHKRIADFPEFYNKAGAAGLTEVHPDIFAVAVGPSRWDNRTGAPIITAGPTAIYTLDFNKAGTDGLPEHKKLAVVADAGFLNGLTTVPSGKYVLAADSLRGVIWRIDTRTGAASIAVSDPALAANPDATFPIGINGVHVDRRGAFAYFDNSGYQTLGRVPISATGAATGPAQLLAHFPGFVDDFALDADERRAYVATNNGNSLLRVDLDSGAVAAFAGSLNSSAVPGPTSLSFGTRPDDRGSLYVATNGGLVEPVNGSYVEGGSVKRIRT